MHCSENWLLEGQNPAFLLSFPCEWALGNQIVDEGNFYFKEDFQQKKKKKKQDTTTVALSESLDQGNGHQWSVSQMRPAGSSRFLKAPPMMDSCQKSLPTWNYDRGEISKWLQPGNTSSSNWAKHRTKRGQGDIWKDIRGCIIKPQNVGDSAGQNWFL